MKILNFQGPLKLTPFYRDSIENRQFRGQKSKSSRGNFRGEFPPPSSVRYVLTPPYPGFRKMLSLVTVLYGKGLDNRKNYPLARNQYINNSPGIFSCIRPGVNTCPACICTEINSPKIFLCIGTRDVQIQALYQYRGQGPKCEYIFQK